MAQYKPQGIGYLGEHLAQLQQQVPCRKEQLTLLLSVLGKKAHNKIQSVFIYGTTATGKSYLVERVMGILKLPSVTINCIECYTNRLLFEEILNQVSGHRLSRENGYSCYTRCENMNDFVRLLKSSVQERSHSEGTTYLILDKAERLRFMDGNLLPSLLRLRELSGCDICVVLISELVWEKFRGGTGFLEPFVVHFPDYTKDEVLEIMTLDAPSEYETDFYVSYFNLLMNVFMVVCRNLNELRHLAVINFPLYIQPIVNGVAKTTDSRKLWRNIEPHLRQALQTVYLREVSSAQWECSAQSDPCVPTTHVTRNPIELPYYSKYLLIAAYLASYNPAKSDKRFFAKNAGKSSRQSKLAKRHERTSNQLLGPKPFPLDRLMAIFYAIIEENVTPVANIFSQISSLVTLQLLSQLGGDVLDVPKYKCVVSLDFIRHVAKTVHFDVVKYLYDFV